MAVVLPTGLFRFEIGRLDDRAPAIALGALEVSHVLW